MVSRGELCRSRTVSPRPSKKARTVASSSSMEMDMAGCFDVGTAPYSAGWCGGGPRRLCSSRGLCGRSGCGEQRGVGGRRAWAGCLQRCEKTRWGTSSAERGCGQAPMSEQGMGDEGVVVGESDARPCSRLLVLSKLWYGLAWVGKVQKHNEETRPAAASMDCRRES